MDTALRARVAKHNLKAKKARARRRWFAFVPFAGAGVAFAALDTPIDVVLALPLMLAGLWLVMMQ